MSEGKPTVEFDEYGEIRSTLNNTAYSKPEVDSDDLPENQGITPRVGISRLKERLAKAITQNPK